MATGRPGPQSGVADPDTVTRFDKIAAVLAGPAGLAAKAVDTSRLQTLDLSDVLANALVDDPDAAPESRPDLYQLSI